ncbi:MAG: hypothetical protein ABI954_04465 [Pyrinomonadaceae bacterium]
MKTLLILIWLIALCALFPFDSFAQTSVNSQQELTAVYAAQDKAIRARDRETIAAFYAPDYIAETKQGTLKRDESLKNLQSFFDSTDEITTAKTIIERVEQVEETNIAFVTRQIKGVMVFAGGKKREFEVNMRAEEHWTKTRKGAWLMHAGVERSQTLKIDGINENTDVLESSRTELEAIYIHIDEALTAQNTRAMFVYWATDFTEIQDGKKSTSAEVEEAVNALFAQITEAPNVVHKINDIKTADGNYVVAMMRTITGKMNNNGKTVPFEYSYQAQESWVKTDQRTWKLQTSEILSDKFLIDGKEAK